MDINNDSLGSLLNSSESNSREDISNLKSESSDKSSHESIVSFDET